MSRDACVVDAQPLTRILRRFLAAWSADRPAHGTAVGARDHLGAVCWLAAETGVPESTIEKIAAGRSRTTELRVADALVTGLGRPEAFHDGTLTVRPNPNAPRSVRRLCCGGSES